MVVLMLLGMMTAAAEEKMPSGRLTFESTSAGFIVGVRWGSGTLTFNGEEYPFSVKGYVVPAVGAAKGTTLGVVYDLSDVMDFEGRYFAAEGGLTAIQGGGSVVMRNDKGVIIYLDALQQGLELSLGGGSITFELDPASLNRHESIEQSIEKLKESEKPKELPKSY